MAKFDLAIFDVDGTLLDTQEGIVSSVIYAARTCGLSTLTKYEIKRLFIGPPIGQGFQNAYAISGKRLMEVVAVFRDHYIKQDLLRAKPYDGIFELCNFLQEYGTSMAIATYKRHDYALKLLEAFGFNRFTHNIHGSDFKGKFRKSDIIEQCILESGFRDRSRIVMIGDCESDAQGAEEAGIAFLGVTYGYGFVETGNYAFPTIDDVHKISKFLK